MILVVLAIGSSRSGARCASVSPVAGFRTIYAGAATRGGAPSPGAAATSRVARTARTASRRGTRRMPSGSATKNTFREPGDPVRRLVRSGPD